MNSQERHYDYVRRILWTLDHVWQNYSSPNLARFFWDTLYVQHITSPLGLCIFHWYPWTFVLTSANLCWVQRNWPCICFSVFGSLSAISYPLLQRSLAYRQSHFNRLFTH